MSRTVCILYGLNEGPGMGQRLIAALAQADIRSVDDPSNADIIFAHSAGCYLVPATYRASVVVLTGLPYWPGKPVAVRLAIKVWREWRLYRRQGRLKEWRRKWRYNFQYMLNVQSHWRMATRQNIGSAWNNKGRQVIVRNHYDCMSSQQVLNLPFKGPRTFIALTGEHDDCWEHPNTYVNLLQSLLHVMM